MLKLRRFLVIGLIFPIIILAVFFYNRGTSGIKAKAHSNSPETKSKITICIDPGHQSKAITKQEPLGPGSKEKKTGVSSGTRGIYTKKYEYQLNLEVSYKIKAALENMGYKVIMTRYKNDVSLSNIERAGIANNSGAVLFVRIHADGSNSKDVKGFSVLYPSKDDIYTKKIYSSSKLSAELIEKELKKSTGSISRGIVPRNDMTGFNWSKIPCALVEMGFMSNKDEDIKMSTESYQNDIAKGIANGIDLYVKETQDIKK